MMKLSSTTVIIHHQKVPNSPADLHREMEDYVKYRYLGGSGVEDGEISKYSLNPHKPDSNNNLSTLRILIHEMQERSNV